MGSGTGQILGAIGDTIDRHAMLYQAAAESRAGRYQDRVAQHNARLAEQAAADALDRGSVEESRQRARTGQLIGSQRAAYASAGVDVASGSALDVVGDTAAIGELDARTIRNNAAREAWGLQAAAYNLRAEGKLARAAARSRSRALTGAAVAQLFRDIGKSMGGGGGGFGGGFGGGGA